LEHHGFNGVTFKWKDYRFQGRDRFKTMTLDTAEFIRRFLLHVLPSGFHRIRHYGLFAGTCRARNIERVRQALAASGYTASPISIRVAGRSFSPRKRYHANNGSAASEPSRTQASAASRA
jgi:hypothetical protein